MTTYTPRQLFSQYRLLRAPYTSKEFYNRAGLSRIREMWCAARFGQGVEQNMAPCKIIMDSVDDQGDTDFTLSFPNASRDFQVVEIQKPGRRRGDEYRDREPGATWTERLLSPDEAIEVIRSHIQAKADKHYARQANLHLLAYVNFGGHDLELATIRSHCRNATAGFAGVWLMTGELFGCIHLAEDFEDHGWFPLPPSPED